MDGPWYECQGPTAEQVRKDVSEYISKNSSNINYPLTNDILLKIKVVDGKLVSESIPE